jgi:hypothetical protein
VQNGIATNNDTELILLAFRSKALSTLKSAFSQKGLKNKLHEEYGAMHFYNVIGEPDCLSKRETCPTQ